MFSIGSLPTVLLVGAKWWHRDDVESSKAAVRSALKSNDQLMAELSALSSHFFCSILFHLIWLLD